MVRTSSREREDRKGTKDAKQGCVIDPLADEKPPRRIHGLRVLRGFVSFAFITPESETFPK
jgi:hypothetical protein